MRYLRVFACLLLLLSAATHRAPAQLFVGATGSISSTSLNGDTPVDAGYTSRTGFGFGAIIEYSVMKDIRLSIQPSFTRRGTGVAYDIDQDELRDSLSLALDYASIPIMARFLSPGGAWFVNGGVDAGILLDATIEDIHTGAESDVTDAVNDVDVMMILGVGTLMSLDPVLLSLELRYGQSIINAGANNQLTAAVGIPLRFRSSGFQILAAVLFPL